jgi:hypothetical protein
MTIYKIRAGRITTVPATEHVGEKGQIFYDEDTGELRLSDGETPGGISITSGGGGTGPRGATGTAATITVGTVTVSTTTASVTNVGTTSSAILNFVLQQGPQGIQGPIGNTGTQGIQGPIGATGTAATITIGEVTVSTSTATVTNVGTTSSAILNFVLQQGTQGIKGDTGNTGTQGATGTAATITVGTVTVSTTTASVTNVGTTSSAILNFVLQQGPPGTTGGGGGGAGQFTPAVYTTSSTSTAVIDVTNIDQYNITSLSADVTFSVTSTVTPDDGQRLLIRIRSDATPRNLTWTQTANQFRTIGISFPTITSASKLVYIGCVYNAVDGYWDLISSLQQP